MSCAVAHRSLSEQTANARRVAQRSQSIAIAIPKRLTKGTVYLRSDGVGSRTLLPGPRRMSNALDFAAVQP